MAQGEESPASFACQHAPLCQVSCGLVYSDRFPCLHEQCMLVRVSVAVDSLLCNSLVVDLDTDPKSTQLSG